MDIAQTTMYVSIGTAIAFLSGFARVIWELAKYKSGLEVVTNDLSEHIKEGWGYKKHAEELEAKVKANDVRFAQIETDLQWIKATLVKIDQKIQ